MKTRITLLILFLAAAAAGFFLFVEKEKPIKTSGALNALQIWNEQRAYPDDDIPAGAYFLEYQKMKSVFKNSLTSEEGEWNAIGPHNIGGRTISLAFNPQNPNTIYAGSASGGLWRSYTGGLGVKAWDLVPTGYPVLGVGSIAIAPDDSNTIYIGSGEVYNYQNSIGGVTVRITRGSYGIGILKSTDGGETWVKSLDWSRNQERGVWAVRINPLNSNTVWAGTTEGTYKSTDGGATWNKVHSTIMVMDLAINPVDTNMIWIACGNLNSAGKGIYRTTDGGTTWTKLTSGVPGNFGGKIQLSVYPQDPSIVFASVGFGYTSGAGTTLLKTTNSGDTWQTVSTMDYSTYQGWFAHFAVPRPDNDNILICGGVDVFKSTNGGQTLNQKSYWYKWYFGQTEPGEPEGPPDYVHADNHVLLYHPTNYDIIYFGTDGGVFRSTDGGETFSGCNGGYQTTQFYNGFSSSFLDTILAMGGMQDNATAIYKGGPGWFRTIGGDGSWTAIDASNDNILYGSSQYLAMRRSTDRGESFQSVSPPGAGAGFIAPFVSVPLDPSILFAGGSLIYKSTNRGSSWGPGINLNGNPLLCISASLSSIDVVYAATAPVTSRSGVFVTLNGGTSWQNITGSLPDRYPMDIAVDPVDPGIAYVVFSGFGTGHVFKTTDAGANWEDITNNLPDVPANAVIVDFDYPDLVYVGNDLGVFVSTNGGDNWETFQQGIDDAVIVLDLSISPLNRKIRAVTHGSGVFERKMLEPTVDVKLDAGIITGYELLQNFPNPFNNQTIINYRLKEALQVSLTIHNINGEIVRELISAKHQSAGLHKIAWDGKNNSGERTASGIYFYQLNAGNFQQTKKMQLIK